MALPSFYGTGVRLATATGLQDRVEIIPTTNGGAFVYYFSTTAAGAPSVVYTVLSATGVTVGSSTSNNSFLQNIVAADVANIPAGGAMMLLQTASGGLTYYLVDQLANHGPQGSFAPGGALVGSPKIESTTEGLYGVYVQSAALGPQANAIVFGPSGNGPLEEWDTPTLNNGSGRSMRDVGGVPWNVIDGAGVGNGNLAVATTRGTGASTVIQLHFVSKVDFEDIGVPITIASGSGINVASFQMTELATGNFIASWIDGTRLVAQQFGPTGTAIGSALQVDSVAGVDLEIVPLTGGEVLFVWADKPAGTANYDIFGQRFTSAGAASDGIFRINANGGDARDQRNPSATQLGGDNILVVYDDGFGDGEIGLQFLSYTRPDAVSDFAATTTGNAVTINVLANDGDPTGGGSLRVSNVTTFTGATGTNGSLSFTPTGVTYTPTAGFAGTSLFSYELTNAAGRTDFANVFVTVTGPVNVAPQFTSPATATAPENRPITFDSYLAVATDAAGQTIRYTLGGVDAAALSINELSGSVRLRAPADFETKASYSFTVTATDSATPALSTTQAVTLTITNVNEAPQFAASTAAASIAENSAATTVVYTAAAVDPDAGTTLAYSLGGADAGALNINSATGAVTLKASPDFEAKANYSFTVTATDNATTPLSATQTVALTITDVNETPTPAAIPFFLLVPAAGAATVQGTGTVFGASGSTQDITVLDAPGRVSFEGSFNTGGDRIRLSGNAGTYTVLRNGSTVEISDGDTTVAVPVGTGGADIIFGDGVRSLSANLQTGQVSLGGQVLTTSAATITAAAGPAVATGATSATANTLFLVNPGASVTALGTATVFGTIAGAERVTVGTGARLTFEGSFNAGGDTIVLPGTLASYGLARNGASLVVTGAEQLSIPVGLNALTLQFADQAAAVRFVVTNNQPTLFVGAVAVAPAASAFGEDAGGQVAMLHDAGPVMGEVATYIV